MLNMSRKGLFGFTRGGLSIDTSYLKDVLNKKYGFICDENNEAIFTVYTFFIFSLKHSL